MSIQEKKTRRDFLKGAAFAAAAIRFGLHNARSSAQERGERPE